MTTENTDAKAPLENNNVGDVPSSSSVASQETASEPQGSEASPSAEEAADTLIAEVIEETSLADELEAAKAEIADWNEKYLRLHAEWDTYRRRMNEEKLEAKKQANEKIVSSLIPVLDDFERTIDYGTKNGEKGLLDGIKAVYSKLVDTLEKDGVEVINPVGEAFDSLQAQAVQMVEDTSVPDETVAQVFQKGYKLGIKVIRPAMVIVATGGPKREKPEEESE